MKHAPIKSLAEVAESIRYGYTASATEIPVGPHFLRITDIVPSQIEWDNVPYCQVDDKNRDRFRLEPGDIVIARTGATTGYAKLIRDNPEAVFASYLVRVRVNPQCADPGYVGRIVESSLYKRFVWSQIGGAAQPNASAKRLAAFRFPVPKFDKQRRIVELLRPYEELIENNRRRIHLLEESARLLYREWFVHLRFPGHEHVRIEDGVPDGWERKAVGNIAQTLGGGTPSTKNPEFWEGGDVVWFTPTDLTRNDCLVLLDSEKKITEEGLKRSSAKRLPPWTILMTSRASIGYFGLYEDEATTNQGFIAIILADDRMRMFLLHQLMNRVEEIVSLAGGTTYREINKTTFRSMDVLVPPVGLCEEFERFATDIFDRVLILKKQNHKLAQARDLLLPRLMNGEIAV